jgi:bacillithiol biosynthesis cysteine-adding enzyme BshC
MQLNINGYLYYLCTYIMSFKKTEITLAETGYFSKLILDYISGDKELRPLYTYVPVLDSFRQAIEDKSKEAINRDLLTTVLKEQHALLPGSELQIKHIESLRDKKTFTVCTGHQLCLFTGPLYFIYKIISTINLAEVLKKNYPECNFVPVYWMAGEDHDFEEVRSVNLFGKKLSWNNPEAKGAVGNLETASIKPVLEELQQIAGDSANAKELMQLFNDAYLQHTTLAGATRYLVHQLFAAYGLVIVDGNDGRLKKEFVAILEDDIFENTNYMLVDQTIAELEQMGVKAQVNPRLINCFYMLNNIRERIEWTGDRYGVLNTDITFTKEQLQNELKEHPERFSPNVVLRPLYQQKILPNLAYIGGPGEIAYWLEYKRMFEHHHISFPVLIPRNFALLLDQKSEQQLQKLGFTIPELFKDTEALVKEFINKNAGEGLSLKEQEQQLTDLFAVIATKATIIDPTLKASVEAELQKALNSLKNIESKLVRSEKQKQETSINQIRKLKDKFFPDGSLQERYDTLTPYYLKSGKQLIADLKTAFDPLDYKMLVIEV